MDSRNHRSPAPPPEDLDTVCRNSQDERTEECGIQTAALAAQPPEAQNLFEGFRRKLATGEALSRALTRLAEALRFTGRITITLHQGKITKTVLEESYFGGQMKL